MLSFPEVNELSDEVRRVFEELDRSHAPGCRQTSSLHTPALDVVETPASIEVFVDVPGLAATDLRVLFKEGCLVVVGEKLAPDTGAPGIEAFHLVERSFGRFARVIRLTTAIDGARCAARIENGELRVSLPRIEERRGVVIAVPVEDKGAASS
ncbi:MAG: Hsp20/alpha crystallin family protein [Acidobacteria bacterium]|nr:Hsp20/alpha crystallin family protein [Acidobacteriota bacterium]